MNPATLDRAAGVLKAQAAGDALGVPYEFATPPAGDAEMAGGGLGPYDPGEWSDDTQMALCIAQVVADGSDPRDRASLDRIAERFLGWRRDGASDIGILTSQVLGAADRAAPGPSGTGRPAERLVRAARDYDRRTGRSASNGALMCTAVVGLTHLRDREATAESARAVAELTHTDPLAGDSCVLWCEAVRVAVSERRLDVRAGLDLLPSGRRARWSTWIDDAERPDAAADLGDNGFTVTALQAAWHAIATTQVPTDDPGAGSHPCQHLQHAMHAAVRIGGDTHTVAAIAGGLLGAYWGASAVPAAWRRVLHGWPGLRARDLVRLGVLTATGGRSDLRGWPAGDRVEHLWVPVAPGVAHPLDDGVVLGTTATVDPACDAVVSLCQRGTAQVAVGGVAPGDHVEVWLIDSDRPEDNPNLDFVLADTAAVVAELRAEGRRVLLHCVAAQQRTPTVAVAYGVHLGATHEEAARAVLEALPGARAHGLLWDRVSAG
ncbi:ADP-ribosylglycohydrolase [Georgenia soli]|uniref:ADP-ribosylglycohydrolase n=1 Tax=Georgenia soli TaxID=638953 RepID=A0A2A9EMT7_9MICO|nr:ADP-ribosylglycohydrolase family protein [Georgenia soli]PFG39572.1 ADP-ribosylglycohydrolase [Georgenia soli]